jgi:mannosyltransferase OCH1-like enzyme
MGERQALKVLLNDLRGAIARGEYGAVDEALDALARDGGAEALGSPTALGVPRKLQSVMLSLSKARGDALRQIGFQFHLVPPPDLLLDLGRTSTTERVALAEAARQPVPRVLHQVWIGPKSPPEATTAWRAHAMRHAMEYRLWREVDLAREGIDRDPVFAAMIAQGDYPGAVDVARYAILRDFGGIYLDCDWYPARHDVGLAEFLPMQGLIAMAEEVPRLTGMGTTLLANSFIAAPRGHPAMARLVDALPQALERLPEGPAWWVTGPLLFTIVARAGALTLADARLVAGEAPAGASLQEIDALCDAARREDRGPLLAWKPW